jgi:hypothetical protein
MGKLCSGAPVGSIIEQCRHGNDGAEVGPIAHASQRANSPREQIGMQGAEP